MQVHKVIFKDVTKYFSKDVFKHFSSFFLAFFLCSFIGFSQSTSVIQGIVVNQKTGKALKNVHIVNINQETGTISRANGSFEIEALTEDTIHISIIGYESIRDKVANFSKEDDWVTISLVEQVYQLDAINIYNVPSPEEFKQSFLDLEVPEYYAEIELPEIPKQRTFRFNEEAKLPTYVIKGPITALYKKFNKHQRMLAEAQNRLDKYAAYNKFLFNLAKSVTGYEKKQDIQEFLHFCNLEVAYINAYNDYDLTQALEFCFVEYNN